MNDPIKKKAAAAKVILVPKGDDSEPCLQAFQKVTGISVPPFENRKLEARAGGKTFLKVKGRDIPRFIAAGYGDMGLTGSDSCEEYAAVDGSVDYRSFGPRMCRFVLLAPAAGAAAVKRKLKASRRPIAVATSFPELLRRGALRQGINISPVPIGISGSVEIMPELLGVTMVADLVVTGETARRNGLAEICDLADVYPAVITRSVSASGQGRSVSGGDIADIDAVLELRSRQLSDGSAESYTLRLMRDANEAGKKAGEEFGEVMMAIAGSGDVADCESEMADLTYAQLVAAYSRGKPARLSNVLRILVDRNKAGGSYEDL